MERVFISYKTCNQKLAEDLVSELEKRALNCWIASRDVPKGEAFDDHIPKAIADCRLVVMLLSDDAMNSSHMKNELRIAVKYRKKIIPFMLEDIDLREAFEYHIESNNRISADKNWNKAVEELLDCMKLEFKEMLNQSEQPVVCNGTKETGLLSKFMSVLRGIVGLSVNNTWDRTIQCPMCKSNKLIPQLELLDIVEIIIKELAFYPRIIAYAMLAMLLVISVLYNGEYNLPAEDFFGYPFETFEAMAKNEVIPIILILFVPTLIHWILKRSMEYRRRRRVRKHISVVICKCKECAHKFKVIFHENNDN